MIKKIKKLSKGIFQRTDWNKSAMPEFKRFNLIYGWNGTGKTTLADAFYFLEKHSQQDNEQFKVDWEKNYPKAIRVFNKKFVQENVFRDDKTVSPIYILGKGEARGQKRINILEPRKRKLELAKSKHEGSDPTQNFEKFCTDVSNKLIKQVLRSGNTGNRFNNYDKTNFKDDIAEMDHPDQYKLSDKDKDVLRQSINVEQRSEISSLNIVTIKLNQEEIAQVFSLIKETASANFIEELLESPQANQWVSSGMELHQDRNKCFFCDNVISEERRKKLNEHFNDAVNALKDKITHRIAALKNKKSELQNYKLPDCDKFYPDIKQEYQPKILQRIINDCMSEIAKLITLLEEKLNSLHEPLKSNVVINPVDGLTEVEEINGLISRHNKKTVNLDKETKDAREKFAKSILAENYQQYQDHQNNIKVHQDKLQKYQDIIGKIEGKISQLTREIRNHRIPAENINDQLKKYLGYDEINFVVKDNGYEIHRRGQEASSNLCESERTAVALIVYLNSLSTETFKIKEGVVVLDDPISSLDNKAIFTAFTLIKEHIEGASQIFLLTHNFEFMNQIKRWFINKNKKTEQKNEKAEQKDKPVPAEFFMLLNRFDEDGVRFSVLMKMDDLIKKYQSEYHYNFKVVYECANSNQQESLVKYMPIPNVLRKLIETFSAFQFPNRIGFDSWLKSFEPEQTKQGKLERFLNVLSHSDSIGAVENMNDHYLQDAPQVCLQVIDKIKEHNSHHYEEMQKLINRETIKIIS